MNKLLAILLFLTCKICIGQNLVPNPGFEIHTNCPQNIGGIGDLNYATPWFAAVLSPDYFNACDTTPNNLGVPSNDFGNQLANTGVAYAGFYAINLPFPNQGREYIEVLLIDTLKAGVKYQVSFYVSLADVMYYGVNNIGCYFSANPIMNTSQMGDYLSYIPQIVNNSSNVLTGKNGWTLITDTFTALGVENYLTIGNFSPDSLSDTTYVGGPGWGNVYSYYFVDDVSVSEITNTGIADNNTLAQVVLFPNPFSNQFTFKYAGSEKTTFFLYDFIGRQILQQTFTNSIKINTEQLANGIYFYQLRNSKRIIANGKVVRN